MSTIMSATTQAFLLATLSAFFNGSFAACAKLTKSPIDPILFTFYNSIGVLFSSFLVTPLLPFLSELPDDSIYRAGAANWTFTYLGVIAASLYIAAAVLSFATVKFIGLGIGQGVWGGAAILVSFLWGVLVLGDTVDSPGIAALSLATLLLGIAGIALNDVVGDRIFGTKRGSGDEMMPFDNKKQDPSDIELNESDVVDESTSNYFTLGILCALGVGLFGGSILVPMSFVDVNNSGLDFVPSFGIGCIFASTIVMIGYYGFFQRMSPLGLMTLDGFLLGALSGIIWNAGNICSIFAITGIGYATAYPILQCALFFAGLWGIFVFKEVTDKNHILAFFCSAFVLFGGAVLLSINTNA